jgi:hypothetical protein
VRGQHAGAGARQWGREDEATEPLWAGAGELARYAAAHVVAGEHRSLHGQLVNQCEDARGLRLNRVCTGRFLSMLVGHPEAPQVRGDDVGMVAQKADHLPPIAVVAGPAVKEDDRIAMSFPDICESKSIKCP